MAYISSGRRVWRDPASQPVLAYHTSDNQIRAEQTKPIPPGSIPERTRPDETGPDPNGEGGRKDHEKSFPASEGENPSDSARGASDRIPSRIPAAIMAYFGGRGQGADGGWFVPGADGWALPWGRGAGAAAAGASGSGGETRETLAAVMARRAPPPSAIRRDAARAAEAAAGEVVLRVHPTQEAERRRQDVIGYLRRLIGSSLGCEVRALRLPPASSSIPLPPSLP